MEQKNIQVNKTDWLTFFKLPDANPVVELTGATYQGKPAGYYYTARPTSKAPQPNVYVTAPPEITNQPDSYAPEYMGNAEPIYYDVARLNEFLFKAPARFFHATPADFAFQDYRKPLDLSGINCNISNPGFSFLTIAEAVGIPDRELINYGLIYFKYIGK